jgi:predicted DNA-binding transcriptional regulator AlpA
MITKNPLPQPSFTKLESVAKQVGLGKSTVLAWEATGRFPRAVRLSATVRVWLQQDIVDWIFEQHSKNTARNARAES